MKIKNKEQTNKQTNKQTNNQNNKKERLFMNRHTDFLTPEINK